MFNVDAYDRRNQRITSRRVDGMRPCVESYLVLVISYFALKRTMSALASAGTLALILTQSGIYWPILLAAIVQKFPHAADKTSTEIQDGRQLRGVCRASWDFCSLVTQLSARPRRRPVEFRHVKIKFRRHGWRIAPHH